MPRKVRQPIDTDTHVEAVDKNGKPTGKMHKRMTPLEDLLGWAFGSPITVRPADLGQVGSKKKGGR